MAKKKKVASSRTKNVAGRRNRSRKNKGKTRGAGLGGR
jgi:hypothetical protein